MRLSNVVLTCSAAAIAAAGGLATAPPAAAIAAPEGPPRPPRARTEVRSAAAPQQRPAEEILAKLQERYESVEVVSCEFRQHKRVRQLQRPLDLTGSMTFQKPGLMRTEIRGDENFDVYVNGETVWLVDLDLQEVETYPIDSDGGLRALRLLSPLAFLSPQELRERYRVASLPAQRERYRLSLEPVAANGVEVILLEIDRRYRTRWMRIEYATGDWTETEFVRWKKHRDVSPTVFEYPGQ